MQSHFYASSSNESHRHHCGRLVLCFSSPEISVANKLRGVSRSGGTGMPVAMLGDLFTKLFAMRGTGAEERVCGATISGNVLPMPLLGSTRGGGSDSGTWRSCNAIKAAGCALLLAGGG